MGKKNKAIDAYIAKSPAFAKPILIHFRALIHKTCPDVEETIKWSMPFYDYKNNPICMSAAFKEHCAIRFWKTSLIKGIKKEDAEGMSSFGRITSLKDMPSDKKLIGYIKEAMLLNEKGIKIAKTKPGKAKELPTPSYFKKAFAANKKASQEFEKFSPSKKKDYITWLIEAKTEETRAKRMETALEWIAEGKGRNWRYEKK
jgi:uncharacterized protein YdeI (YjbR/CyaY-like superfamily)